ncbi:helix-turn-helix domain-containing protein [Chloroflexota bacterium]
MEFGAMLKRLRAKAGKSRYKLAQWTGLSEAYLLRLENGERNNPGRDVVLLIALALVSDSPAIDVYDIEELMLSASYAPLKKRGAAEAVSLPNPS